MPLSVEKRDLTGLTAVVTGGNAGIGYETVRMLSEMGANVTIACRNAEKGQAAAEGIEKISGKKPDVGSIDLCNFASVAAFVEDFKSKHDRIDILVNNAGFVSMAKGDEAYTGDGLETDAQVNHLSQLLLTTQLMPLLKHAAQHKINNFVPRVVVVSSDAGKIGKVNTGYWEKQNKEKLPWFFGRYGDTKLAFAMVSKKLADTVESDGVIVHMVHPGYVASDIHAKNDNGMPQFLTKTMGWIMNLTARTAAQGAMTSVYCAVSVEAEKSTGKYWYSNKIANYPNSLITNQEAVDKLWNDSANILKERGHVI